MLPNVLSPVITPFDENGEPHLELFLTHCRTLVSQGSGLAVFGTNSEGNSLSVAEKRKLLDRLVEAGIPPGMLMPGTGACARPDAIALNGHAAALGAGGVLLLPPFYYKGVSDEGIFRFVAEVIEGTADDRLRIYLYNIPPMAQVGFSLPLIERLIQAFPEIVVGMKDSSGDFAFTKSVLAAFPGWGTYVGNELNLVEAMAAGARGAISACCNVNAANIVEMANNWRSPNATSLQADTNAVRKAISAFPTIPALKAIASRYYGEPDWARVRAPLVELSEQETDDLISSLESLRFSLQPATREVKTA